MSNVNAPTNPAPNGNRRQQQAQATRDEICRVAERLFLDNGYVATTIDTIARESGVAVQTIYNSVGNKAAILNIILERVVTGTNATVTVSQIMTERVAAAADLPSAIAVLADWMVEFNGRAAAVFAVLRQAAAVIWAIGHPDVYTALVTDSGWSVDAYARWVSGALSRQLMP